MKEERQDCSSASASSRSYWMRSRSSVQIAYILTKEGNSPDCAIIVLVADRRAIARQQMPGRSPQLTSEEYQAHEGGWWGWEGKGVREGSHQTSASAVSGSQSVEWNYEASGWFWLQIGSGKVEIAFRGRGTGQWKLRSRRKWREKPWFLLGKGRIILGGWVDLTNTRLWRPDTCYMILPWGGDGGFMSLSPLSHTELWIPVFHIQVDNYLSTLLRLKKILELTIFSHEPYPVYL